MLVSDPEAGTRLDRGAHSALSRKGISIVYSREDVKGARLLEVDADYRLAGTSGVIWRQMEALLADATPGEVIAPCQC
ncbi:MAG: hypothetical protein TH68_01940 [Candidatus Synechococcus spongiarum 142]|uniref:Uncharacterized protein n=1 Tax=Candidatus Synechococcus spongiarum 142 TaxID=1608213 RepID=A0A6N3X9S9_9SYNE|nr:MAG: hypothetical protein TH68_01940 [Candidatus Synechococcus spongiarum 142]